MYLKSLLEVRGGSLTIRTAARMYRRSMESGMSFRSEACLYQIWEHEQASRRGGLQKNIKEFRNLSGALLLKVLLVNVATYLKILPSQ